MGCFKLPYNLYFTVCTKLFKENLKTKLTQVKKLRAINTCLLYFILKKTLKYKN